MKFETVYNVDNQLDDLLFEYSFMLHSIERLTSHDDYLKILDKQKKKIVEYIDSTIAIVCKPESVSVVSVVECNYDLNSHGCRQKVFKCECDDCDEHRGFIPGFPGL